MCVCVRACVHACVRARVCLFCCVYVGLQGSSIYFRDNSYVVIKSIGIVYLTIDVSHPEKQKTQSAGDECVHLFHVLLSQHNSSWPVKQIFQYCVSKFCLLKSICLIVQLLSP